MALRVRTRKEETGERSWLLRLEWHEGTSFMRSLFRLGTIRIEILCRAVHIGGASRASHSPSRLCGFYIGDRTLA